MRNADPNESRDAALLLHDDANRLVDNEVVWNIRDVDCKFLDLFFDWSWRAAAAAAAAIFLASRRARAAGVSDIFLSKGVANDIDDFDDRELRTEEEESSPSTWSFSFLLLPLFVDPPTPPHFAVAAARYVFALPNSPLSALRAILSRSLSSTTSKNEGVMDSVSPSLAVLDIINDAGRAGSQSADDADLSTADPLPKTNGVDATSPHVIIGSSSSNAAP